MKLLLIALTLTTLTLAETIDCTLVPAYGVCIEKLAGSDTPQNIDAFCNSYSQGLACNKTTAMGICVGTMVDEQGLTLSESLKRCLGT